MALSLREQVVDKINTTLSNMASSSPTLVQDLVVERWRGQAVPPTKMPRLVVGEGTQVKDDETDTHKEFRVSIPIIGFAKAATDAATGTALNDLYARTVEALEEDKTLGLASFVLWSGEGDCEWELDEEEGHAPAGAFTLTWEVIYQTKPTDPYSAPA